MKVAIHQPNYLPHLAYFNKIQDSDIFIFLDNVAYTKNDYTNRNRIKTPQGWCWLTVPVTRKAVLQTPIREVKISNTANWRKKHWNSIKFNYGKAASFSKYRRFFEEIYKSEWSLLAELNKTLIKNICGFLGIKTHFIDVSTLETKGSGTDLLVNICETLDADFYLSGAGGRDYVDHQKFEEKDINIVFQEFKTPVYPQLYGSFIPNLSVIDYLLNCNSFPP